MGITVGLEGLASEVLLIDRSELALSVAEQNAEKFGAKVRTRCGDLLSGVEGEFDVVMANLPYVDQGWEVSVETKFEPEMALFAGDGGLELIKKLVQQLDGVLAARGYLILEADARQHAEIVKYGNSHGLELVEISGMVVVMRAID